MIRVVCAKCKLELAKPGGLAYSPPLDENEDVMKVLKYHICVLCWEKFEKWAEGEAMSAEERRLTDEEMVTVGLRSQSEVWTFSDVRAVRNVQDERSHAAGVADGEAKYRVLIEAAWHEVENPTSLNRAALSYVLRQLGG